MSINNYSLYRLDRIGKDHGGVAFYVNQKYVHSVSKLPAQSESLQIDVNLSNHQSITLIVSYKPPDVSPTIYLQQLSDIIKSVKSQEVIIFGDFNLDWSEKKSKPLKALATKFGFAQLIKTPTRHGKIRNSILDLIFTNQPAKYGISGVIHTTISDHSLIFTIRKCLKSHTVIKTVQSRKYQNQNCPFLTLRLQIVIGMMTLISKIQIKF